MTIEELNIKYQPLKTNERLKEVYKDFSKILVTSSFGTTAALLLHLLSKAKPEQEIYFLNTTYHFVETIEYKEKLTRLLHLKVKDVLPVEWKNQFTREDHSWRKDPDLCCAINKVEPVEKIVTGYQVWVSGLMGWQSNYRKSLRIFEATENIIKFHPLIDMTEEEANQYIVMNRLPVHPLKPLGYHSVGCVHCTVRGKGREGRWSQWEKKECGIHLINN